MHSCYLHQLPVQLFCIIWEPISCLEINGFRVLRLTCDGLAVNRRLFQMHNATDTASDVIV